MFLVSTVLDSHENTFHFVYSDEESLTKKLKEKKKLTSGN